MPETESGKADSKKAGLAVYDAWASAAQAAADYESAVREWLGGGSVKKKQWQQWRRF